MVSVIALFLVKSDEVRLALTVAFSAVFALALVLMTNARKIEVFASTSALVSTYLGSSLLSDTNATGSFAAVNVVFLTSQLAPGR